LWRWLAADAETGPSLEAMLGIGTRRALRRRLRNDCLRQAFEALGSDLSRLAEQCRRFEARVWPRWKALGPPEPLTNVDALLYDARRAGGRLDLSERHLRTICRPFATS
jgi:hypothetical protein